MAYYDAPSTDDARVIALSAAVKAFSKDLEAGDVYLSQSVIDDIKAFLLVYMPIIKQVSSTLGDRSRELSERNTAIDKLVMCLRDFWEVLKRRVRRNDESAGVLTNYELSLGGIVPNPTKAAEWLEMARKVIVGDADAMAKGSEPMANPSAVELQKYYDVAVKESDDIQSAERGYDKAQEAAEKERSVADGFIKDVIAELRFRLRKKDDSSQRRIMRSYGATFKYLKGEKPDEASPDSDGAGDTGSGAKGKK